MTGNTRILRAGVCGEIGSCARENFLRNTCAPVRWRHIAIALSEVSPVSSESKGHSDLLATQALATRLLHPGTRHLVPKRRTARHDRGVQELLRSLL